MWDKGIVTIVGNHIDAADGPSGRIVLLAVKTERSMVLVLPFHVARAFEKHGARSTRAVVNTHSLFGLKYLCNETGNLRRSAEYIPAGARVIGKQIQQ